MKHRTLRCAAETLVLLLIAVMAVFLAAGLHQRAPDGALSTLSTGWYQLTDGVRREVTLPAALETGPGQTITLYNDTLTDSDGGKVLSARGVEYGIEIRAGETLLYRYEDNAFPKNAQMKGRLWADTELPYGIGGQTLSLTFTELPGRMCRIDAPVLGSAPAVTGRHIQTSLFSAGMMLAMLVLAGSLPKGAPQDTYRSWTAACKKAGARVFLDADGALLAEGIKAAPHLIKPNDDELSRLAGKKLETLEELTAEGRKLLERGIERVVISLGGRGALYLRKGSTIYAEGLRVPVGSTVGAGDSVVAALAYAEAQGLSEEEAVRLSTAAGAANVMCSGTQAAEREAVEALLPKVRFTRLRP